MPANDEGYRFMRGVHFQSARSGLGLAVIALLLALQVSTACVAAFVSIQDAVADVGDNSDIVPVYKLCAPRSVDRLFTADEDERNTFLEDGWEDEGIAFFAFCAPGDGRIPMYRVQNTSVESHSYNYTTDDFKRASLVSAGWIDEGIAWYVGGDCEDGADVYQLSNEVTGERYFTVSAPERDALVAAYWIDEGVGWIAPVGEGKVSELGPLDKKRIVSVRLVDKTRTFTYDGLEKRPSVYVYLEGYTVALGYTSAYDVAYSDNIAAGLATVKVVGKAPYYGSAETQFNIMPTSIAGAKVEVANQIYTGEALEPPVRVFMGDEELVAGTDYVTTYSDNVDVGTAKVAVLGRGNYLRSASGAFEIKRESGAVQPTDGGGTQSGAVGISASDAESSIQLPANDDDLAEGVHSGSSVIMHRLYNPWTGEHFYTSDDSERDSLVPLGWEYEGVGWVAPETSSTPVFRMYNPYAGEHHYTPKADERDALADAGWNYEGIGWYSDDVQRVPLFREYNPYMFSCNHNYTADKDEHDNLVTLGWHDEGIAWYGVASGNNDAALLGYDDLTGTVFGYVGGSSESVLDSSLNATDMKIVGNLRTMDGGAPGDFIGSKTWVFGVNDATSYCFAGHATGVQQVSKEEFAEYFNGAGFRGVELDIEHGLVKQARLA